jgi:hypothetical protein
MYFRLIDHLPDNSEDGPLELNICLICLENVTYDNLRPIDFKTQNTFLKRCQCGGWIHLCCLYKWYHINKSCPICRLYMKKSESIISVVCFKFNNLFRDNRFLFFLIRIYCVFLFILIISYSYDIYQSYFISKRCNDNYTCKYDTIEYDTPEYFI